MLSLSFFITHKGLVSSFLKQIAFPELLGMFTLQSSEILHVVYPHTKIRGFFLCKQELCTSPRLSFLGQTGVLPTGT